MCALKQNISSIKHCTSNNITTGWHLIIYPWVEDVVQHLKGAIVTSKKKVMVAVRRRGEGLRDGEGIRGEILSE